MEALEEAPNWGVIAPNAGVAGLLPENRELAPKPDDAPEDWAVAAADAAEDGVAPNPNPELPNEPPNPEKADPVLGEAPNGDEEAAGVAED